MDVAVVGAGLAGLACSRVLARAGVQLAVLEAGERAGGRVATDEREGFLLDRGFQVLLTAYPEARRALDLEALALRAFVPGSLVHRGGRSWRVVDPWRAPLRGLATLRAPFVSVGDAARMARLRADGRKAAAGRRDAQGSADEELRRRGFSADMRAAFLRPFLGGVTLDPELGIPAWYALALFGWFASGDAALPARGMRALPEQLAAGLPDGALRLGAPVSKVTADAVELTGGERLDALAVVLATDADTTARLLSRPPAPAWSGTTTVHYAAERSPVGEPILVLNGDGPGDGPVNHLCVPSDVQPTYAPAGASLVSVSVLGVPEADDAALDRAVREQLARWYGSDVRAWRHLRSDRIPRALPRTFARDAGPRSALAHEPLVCGDHAATPSIQGALESGRLAAEAVLARLAQPA